MAETPQMEADMKFSQIDSVASYLSELDLLKYSLTNFVAHLDHLGSGGVYIRTRFETFIENLRDNPNSYACLLISRWIEALTWPSDMHTGTNEADAKLCLQTALTWAAGAGRERSADILLALRADANSCDGDSIYPLENAARLGRLSTARILLDRDADFMRKDVSGMTPLSLAARGGHEDVVRILLDRGADVETKDFFGRTPLLSAADAGHEAVVRILLDKGADIKTNNSSQTPLSSAVRGGYEDVVQVLLDRGAEIEMKDIRGWTPLSSAAAGGHEGVVRPPRVAIRLSCGFFSTGLLMLR
ncbi:hypothetical protein G7Z17_g12225 [Cylindrodendrum hubeiense]|uniref:Ankyrin repeat protein n=1 Tax=Cylindrodendrum hubeiense TaxID=595255 RepID=A0A9P5H3I9_9HYPO|nr:hypothetical protein G7Z17_g12225 [Cylindrodendrum hubeiense]